MKKSIIREWEIKTNRFLKGMVIKKVTLKNGIIIHLNRPSFVKQMKQDIQLLITSDDEGNDLGSIHTNLKDLSIIPNL